MNFFALFAQAVRLDYVALIVPEKSQFVAAVKKARFY